MATTKWPDTESINCTAQDIAAGKPQNQIAKEIGCEESTISKFKHKHAGLIEKYAEEYIKAIPLIVQQDINEISASTEISKELTRVLQEESQTVKTEDGKALEIFPKDRINALQKYLEYTGKMRLDIKKSTGLSTSHAPAIVFNQMNILNNNQQVISNVVAGALAGNQQESAELPDGVIVNDDR